jgi:hypothetical protein
VRNSRALLSLSAVLLAASSTLLAQDYKGQGYVFVAPGFVTPDTGAALHFGGGGEGFVYHDLAAGAELGYAARFSDFGGGLGILSLNGSYHFERDEKLSPFMTAGYSLGFHSGHSNLFNYGFGANYWFAENKGIRFEFRDHLNSVGHIVDFRIGFAFR